MIESVSCGDSSNSPTAKCPLLQIQPLWSQVEITLANLVCYMGLRFGNFVRQRYEWRKGKGLSMLEHTIVD